MADEIGKQDSNKDVESGKPVQLDKQPAKEPREEHEQTEQPQPGQSGR